MRSEVTILSVWCLVNERLTRQVKVFDVILAILGLRESCLALFFLGTMLNLESTR